MKTSSSIGKHHHRNSHVEAKIARDISTHVAPSASAIGTEWTESTAVNPKYIEYFNVITNVQDRSLTRSVFEKIMNHRAIQTMQRRESCGYKIWECESLMHIAIQLVQATDATIVPVSLLSLVDSVRSAAQRDVLADLVLTGMDDSIFTVQELPKTSKFSMYTCLYITLRKHKAQ